MKYVMILMLVLSGSVTPHVVVVQEQGCVKTTIHAQLTHVMLNLVVFFLETKEISAMITKRVLWMHVFPPAQRNSSALLPLIQDNAYLH
jgi:hypothetical protein